MSSSPHAAARPADELGLVNRVLAGDPAAEPASGPYRVDEEGPRYEVRESPRSQWRSMLMALAWTTVFVLGVIGWIACVALGSSSWHP